MPRLLVINSSTRTHRRGGIVGDWVAERARSRGDVDVDFVDLRELQLPLYDEVQSPKQGVYELASTIAWSERVAPADAVLIVSPEHNGSFPAALKNALDSLSAEWVGKPVGIVGYGFHGGSRMIDHLSLILPNYRLAQVATDVRIDHPWERAEAGAFVPTESELHELDAVLDALVTATREHALEGARAAS